MSSPGTAFGQGVAVADWVAIQQMVARSCELLDQESFTDWLELFTEDAYYEVTAWSPELDCEQTWLRLTKPELSSLLENVDAHIRDRASRGHLPALLEVTPRQGTGAPAGAEFDAVSRFALLRTDDMGASTLYLTGRFRDVVRVEDGRPRLSARSVRLDTRMFDVGSHLPI